MEFGTEPQIESQDRIKAVTLKDFAVLHQITEERVWEMLEEGQLSARFIHDTILIYRENGENSTVEAAPSVDLDLGLLSNENISRESAKFDAGPAILYESEADWPMGVTADLSTIPRQTEKKPQPRPEEAAELLFLSQNSLAHTVELSKQLLASKDELLLLKDDKIAFLEKQLQDKDLEIRRIMRELENYQTLHKISKNPQILRDLLPEI